MTLELGSFVKHDSPRTSSYIITKYIIIGVHNQLFYICVCIYICILQSACGPHSPDAAYSSYKGYLLSWLVNESV